MDVDEDEHSIEMHLPFIYKASRFVYGGPTVPSGDCLLTGFMRCCVFHSFKVMNGRKFTAVPILVGNTKSKMDEEYGK